MGANVLRNSAYVVILVAGLKAGASLVLPVLLAALLSIACVPLTRRLERLGLPNAVAILAVVLGVMVAMLTLSGIVGTSVARFSDSIGTYETRLDRMKADVTNWLAGLGVDLAAEGEKLSQALDTGALLRLVASTGESLLGVLSNAFVILFLMVFILLEANGFPAKLRRAFGDAEPGRFGQVTSQVYGYLSVKTLMSLLTGAAVALLTALADVDFPVLWGLVAFLFNFIPNVGSILAAVPALLLCLVQHGPGRAAVVALGYVAVNTVVGNVLEPRVMGRRLGLSPLVVVLSLVFWSWVWGPVGMVLSLPLTMVVKILLENSEDFRAAAVLLGPSEPAP